MSGQFVDVETGVDEPWCSVCNRTIAEWHKHLPHCLECNTHHAQSITCFEAELFRSADDKMGDPTP